MLCVEDYQNKLESLLIDTAKTLCDLYKAQNNKENGVWNFGHVNDVDNQHMQLIFPKNGTEVRVSEQEARFCLARYIEKSKIFFYSIETPTNKSYSFSSKSSVRHYMRARTDMTLYDQKHNPRFDIELKAENPAETQSEGSTKEPKTRNFGNYSKDFFKLIMDDYDDKEKRCGVWFQVLQVGRIVKQKEKRLQKI